MQDGVCFDGQWQLGNRWVDYVWGVSMYGVFGPLVQGSGFSGFAFV